MSCDVATSYAYCEQFVRKQQSNFYASFIVLPPEKYRQMCAVYAFMGYSDDLADRDGAAADKRHMLGRWREALVGCFKGDYGDSRILPAFHDTVERCAIPRQYFFDVIDGAEMDLTRSTYDTFEELYDYCYHVASVVGFACVHVWGFDGEDETLKSAEACGLAFQLTNILRDIKEDAARGRIYLPQEDLRDFRVSDEDLLKGQLTPEFKEMMQYQVQRARRYYGEGEETSRHIHAQCRPCFEVMFQVYRMLLDKVEESNYDVFSARVSLTTQDKMAIASRFMSAMTAS